MKTETKHQHIRDNSRSNFGVEARCEICRKIGVRLDTETKAGIEHLVSETTDLLVQRDKLRSTLRAIKALALPGATHIHKVCDDALND